MKKICFLVLVGFCLYFATTAQAEVQYIGELCFQLSTSGTLDTQLMKLEVLSYNTATFPIHGSIFYSCPCLYNECPPQWDPIYGVAVLNNNTIKISLTTSGAGGCTGTLLSQSYSLFLGSTTFNGTFSSTEVQSPASSGQDPSLQSSSGTVTLLTTCPLL